MIFKIIKKHNTKIEIKLFITLKNAETGCIT